MYFVIDALDECEQGLPDLIELISTSLSLSEKVKWLVSSRPTVEFATPDIVYSLVELDTQNLRDPVNAYINDKLSAFKGKSGYTKLVLDDVAAEVLKRAENTFLWVWFVFKELGKTNQFGKLLLNGKDALATIKDFPSGLSSLYGRIMAIIDSGQVGYPQYCKNVLVAATLALRPLTLSELAILADLPPDMPRTITEDCGSFLTITGETVYLIHQSAKDYLKENFELRLQKGGVVQGYADICKRLIRAMSILKRDIYTRRDYGFKPKDLRPPNDNPLVPIRYSCLFWVDHLCDANSQSLDFKKELPDDGVMWEFFNDYLCDENGQSIDFKKELTDNGAMWKFFNDHLANFQSLDKQLADGGAVWKFFTDHLCVANGQSLDFQKVLATGGAVWKFFNDHLVNRQSPDFKKMLADSGIVERFFNCHFLHWLESLSLLGKLAVSVPSIRKLLTQVWLH